MQDTVYADMYLGAYLTMGKLECICYETPARLEIAWVMNDKGEEVGSTARRRRTVVHRSQRTSTLYHHKGSGVLTWKICSYRPEDTTSLQQTAHTCVSHVAGAAACREGSCRNHQHCPRAAALVSCLPSIRTARWPCTAVCCCPR